MRGGARDTPDGASHYSSIAISLAIV
uniref:Uncharacterized protein n=1 Tax=Rhizophora mucronata TaxID=61149 RepID=A0A2P2Q0E8_RHIMU